MAGPTGGYLVAFLATAALVGWTADRGWLARSIPIALAIMIAANAFILAVGAFWLALFVGPTTAFAQGVLPFLVGGLVKAALAAGLVEAVSRATGPRGRRR